MEPEKVTLEEYLGRKGLSSPISDYNLDKVRLPHGETDRQRRTRLKASEIAQKEYSAQRKAAIQEYKEKVIKGEIISKSAIEKSLSTAQGHPDNPAVQAARRVLEKRGIDWRTGKHMENIALYNKAWKRLESYGLHCGNWDETTGKSAICIATPTEEGKKVLGYMDPKTLLVSWVAPIRDVYAATIQAASNYYIDGEAYLVEGRHLCICHRWKDPQQGTEGINFEGVNRNLFCDPQKMGTFLPGIASKEMEISRWPDPELQKTNDEQKMELEESEELEL